MPETDEQRVEGQAQRRVTERSDLLALLLQNESVKPIEATEIEACDLPGFVGDTPRGDHRSVLVVSPRLPPQDHEEPNVCDTYLSMPQCVRRRRSTNVGDTSEIGWSLLSGRPDQNGPRDLGEPPRGLLKLPNLRLGTVGIEGGSVGGDTCESVGPRTFLGGGALSSGWSKGRLRDVGSKQPPPRSSLFRGKLHWKR